jgi:hypothetical protein
VSDDKITTIYDYEVRWNILFKLIHNEMELRVETENYKIDNGEEFRKVFHWMLAIDTGIQDVERKRQMKLEQNNGD